MFYRVGRNCVYMHDNLYEFVKLACISEGTLTTDDFKGLVTPPDLAAKKVKAMIEYLSEVKKDNDELFSRLCMFKFDGNDCRSNIWELLNDYSILHRSYYLEDVRGGIQRITDDMMGGTSFQQPMGRKFLFVHGTQRNSPMHWFFRNHSTSVEIDVNNVIAIEGNLDHIQIMFRSGTILVLNNRHMTIHQSSYMPLDPYSNILPNC